MHYRKYQTILSPKNNLNLYRGCSYGCIYCDSRSACYQMDHPFEDIEVKEQAIEILEQQLSSRRKPAMIGTGAMTDPYLPLESRLQLTRQALELVAKYGFGVTLLTKSNRILRDLDLLEKINQQTKAVVQLTLTTGDEALCRKIEPYASTTAERFQVLLECQRRKIPTIVWLCPILPFINDSQENLQQIMDYCIEAGVKGIICFGFGLTLREGNREFFYQQLDQKFPGLKQRYQATYGNQYVCNSPNQAELMASFHASCQKAGIMHQNDPIFNYLQKFEDGIEQLSLF